MRNTDVRGLRILMTVDAVGGVFTYALTLAAELAQRGAEVVFATMGAPMKPAQRAAASRTDGLLVYESTFALEWMPEPWEQVARAGDWLRDLERTLAPDLIHLNGYCHGAIGFSRPVVISGHSCVTSWWEAVVGEPPPSSLDRYRTEVRRGLEGASFVIAPSAAMLNALERHYGPFERTAVIYNGAAKPKRARAFPKEMAVLGAGRLWDRGKNIDALARVAPSFPGSVRIAGGDGLDGRRFPGVTMLGWIDADALGEQMERAAVFAHPARYEPFGLCPLEAALRGCALVLGDIASLREVWANAAVFVDPKDDDALAAALQRMARDEKHRSVFASRARGRAAMFTAERMAEETIAVYHDVLGPRETANDRRPRRGMVTSCA